MKWLPLIGLWFARKDDKDFFGLLVVVNVAYIILTGFLVWFLNLPIFA